MSTVGNTNVQHKYVGNVSLRRDMEIMDLLPVELRIALKNSRLDFCAETVARMWKIQKMPIWQIIRCMRETEDEIIAQEKIGAK